MLGAIVLLIILFQVMLIMIQYQFLPILQTIKTWGKIPSSIAGITLIAFGNGAADISAIFSSLGGGSSADGKSAVKLGFGEMLGSTILISLTTVGLIGLTASSKKPLKLSSGMYLRDSLFLVFSLWLFAIFSIDSKLELWEGLFMALFYCAYVFLSGLFAICGDVGIFTESHKQLTISNNGPSQTAIQIQNERAIEATHDDDLISITGLPSAAPSSTSLFADPDQSLDLDYFQPALHFTHSFPTREALTRKLGQQSLSSPIFDARQDIQEQEPDLDEEDCLEFNPVQSDPLDTLKKEFSRWTPFVWPVRCYWTKLQTWEKVLGAVQAPVIAVLIMTAPVLEEIHLVEWKEYTALPIEPEIVMEDDDQIIHTKNEYPLSLLLCQLFFAPIIWSILVYVEQADFASRLLPRSIVAGILLAGLFRYLCRDSHSISHYAGILLIVGFIQAITLIVSISDIIVQNMMYVGTELHIPTSVLGLTALAFGNSIGELVTNTYVANQVSVMTGLTACYGGPIMNILLGIGGSTIIHSFASGGEPIRFEPVGIPFWIAFGMLMFGLLCSIGILGWFKFKVTRGFSYFIIGYSIVLYVSAILAAVLLSLN